MRLPLLEVKLAVKGKQTWTVGWGQRAQRGHLCQSQTTYTSKQPSRGWADLAGPLQSARSSARKSCTRDFFFFVCGFRWRLHNNEISSRTFHRALRQAIFWSQTCKQQEYLHFQVHVCYQIIGSDPTSSFTLCSKLWRVTSHQVGWKVGSLAAAPSPPSLQRSEHVTVNLLCSRAAEWRREGGRGKKRRVLLNILQNQLLFWLLCKEGLLSFASSGGLAVTRCLLCK